MKPEEILEQLFDNDYVINTITIKNKMAIKLKSLTAEDYFAIDYILNTGKESKLSTLQKYGIAKLSRAILEINGKPVGKTEELYEQLLKKPVSLIDILIKEQTKFEQEIKSVLEDSDKVDESFFETPGSAESLEQLPKA